MAAGGRDLQRAFRMNERIGGCPNFLFFLVAETPNYPAVPACLIVKKKVVFNTLLILLMFQRCWSLARNSIPSR
jgi:hypothetical protein